MMSVKKRLKHVWIDAEDLSIWHRFRRNLSLTLLGSGISLAIKLAQTALLISLLRIDDYGRVLIVLNLFVFLDSFFGLRVSDVMFRFFQQFREQGDFRAVKGLLIFCAGISLLSGVLICGGVLILSPSLADRVYPNLALSPLLTIYSFTVLVSSFSGIYEPILRMHDRFTAVVVPQVVGSLVTLTLLCIYFLINSNGAGGYNTSAIITVFAIGVFVQCMPPLIQAVRLVSPSQAGISVREALQSLRAHRRELADCVLNSNLSGYLKFAINPGDLFFLGLFSSTTQVALYGLAKQLTAPLALLQTNLQTAITPEITALVARERFDQLKRLISRYVGWSVALCAPLLIAAMISGRILILRWLRPEYSGALPVFYALTIVAGVLLIFLAFRPVAVNLDLLRWQNVGLLISAVLLLCFIVAGNLNALTMAYMQLAEALILRTLFNVLVWQRLGARAQLARKSSVVLKENRAAY
jgi:O-antigen/teichoic acid export membrane protein